MPSETVTFEDARIKLLVGEAELLAALDAESRVASADAYVPSYNQIAKAIHRGECLTLAISDPQVGVWLGRMAEKYGNKIISVEKVTFRSVLSSRWSVEIPEWVSDPEIRDAGILDLRVQPSPGQSFEQLLLATFFSPFLQYPKMAIPLLGEFARSYNVDQWNASLAQPLLAEVFRRKISEWTSSTKNEGERVLIDWLKESPELLISQLALYKLLAKYPPELGRRVMGDAFQQIALLSIPINVLPNATMQNEVYLDEIRTHLENLSKVSVPDSLKMLLSQVSGCSEIEFDYVMRGIIAADRITHSEIEQVRAIFSPIADHPLVEYRLADLDKLITRTAPSEPSSDWNEEQWITWAENEYFPYRFWLEEREEYEERLDALSAAYGDWLFSHYPQLRHTSELMAYRRLNELRQLMTECDLALIVVIDNLSARHYPDFVKQMSAQRFFAEASSYCFTSLPTCTEISKRVLLLGDARSQGPLGKLTELKWGRAINRKVRYLANIDALRKVHDREADVFFLNYLPIDILLHQDDRQTGIPHSHQVRLYFSTLARDIRAFAERLGVERSLKVIVVSDHGSMKVPPNAPNPIEVDFFNQLDTPRHHRFLALADGEFSDLPSRVQHQFYMLDREQFELPSHFIAARRFYHFRSIQHGMYVHGGITPEETIVPIAVFSPVVISPKHLSLSLANIDFYIMKKGQIDLEVSNTNSYACTSVRIELRGNKLIGQPSIVISEIPAYSRVTASLDCRFGNSRPGPEVLFFSVAFSFLGQSQHQETELTVNLKTIVEEKTSVFDLD